jgi:soluble lytic murein transglycosylase
VKQLATSFFAFLIGLGAFTNCAADFSRGAGYNPTVAPDRFEQRQMYLNAIHLIRTSQFSRLQKLKPQLRTYPLYPYLEYTEVSYRISRWSEQEILQFIEQYSDTPLVEPLLAHWLANLAKRGKWETFVTHYDKIKPTKKLACQHAYGLYKVGMVDQAMNQAEKLWTVGFSQPEECDPIFNVWRRADGITPKIAWQRFALSLKENNKSLSSYLIRFVDRQDKPFATNYRLVHLKPKTIKRYKSFKATNIRNREIILHGVKRLARIDPKDALLTLRRYAKLQDFDSAELESAYTHIGVRLAGKSSDLALMDSLPVNLHEQTKLVEARIRQSLKHGDWNNVMVLINLLPQEQQDSNRWQYWKARALGISAEEADEKIAHSIMTKLSSERSFYGFVSADILRNHYNYEDEPSTVTLEQILSLEESPGVKRALELFALGERPRARREWSFSTSDFNKIERDVAARVALRWGWYKASIQTMIDSESWNHLDYRFPIAYSDTFIKHARRANIPVQWSLAIARQESAFMPDAKSSSGALGIMQLMPGTAKQVAGKIGVAYANNRSLTGSDLNIRLGTNYLGQMLRKFDNNRILASAAYNAGPGRVNQWLNPNVPFDVWIETIPFSETRNYVQNVLMFSSIYSRRMNERQPIIYPHEQDYFSPQQVSAIQVLAKKLPVKLLENK